VILQNQMKAHFYTYDRELGLSRLKEELDENVKIKQSLNVLDAKAQEMDLTHLAGLGHQTLQGRTVVANYSALENQILKMPRQKRVMVLSIYGKGKQLDKQWGSGELGASFMLSEEGGAHAMVVSGLRTFTLAGKTRLISFELKDSLEPVALKRVSARAFSKMYLGQSATLLALQSYY
jgi:hypothetical protein